MAKIQIKDLTESVELDQKAMSEIIGGRGRKQQYILGIGTHNSAGVTRPITGAFRNRGTSLHKK